MSFEPRRAHPASIAVYAVKFISAIAPIAIVAIAFLGEQEVGPLFVYAIFAIAALALLGAVALAWVEWSRFTYRIEGRTLRIDHGLVVRRSTRLTPERIQTIDTSANLLFRIAGIVTVNVHTAGRGDAPEVSIPALTEHDAAELIALLKPAHPEAGAQVAAAISADPGLRGADPFAPGHPPGSGIAADARTSAAPSSVTRSYRLTVSEILLASAVSSSGVLAMAALAPVVGVPVVMFVADGVELNAARLGVGVAAAAGVVVALGLVLLVVASWIAGTVGALLSNWEFAVARAGDELRVERGLLKRETRTLPLDRVQAVRIIESPLAQMIGRASIGVDAAGIASAAEANVGPTVVHPLVAGSDAARFIETMIPGYDAGPLAGLPVLARRRYVLRAAVVPLVVASALAVVVYPWGLAALAIPLLAVAWGILMYCDAGWSVRDDTLAIRYRRIVRTTVLMKRRRIQSVAVTQHPLQRIAGLATLVVTVASSPSSATFTVVHMGFDDALAVLGWLTDDAASVAPAS